MRPTDPSTDMLAGPHGVASSVVRPGLGLAMLGLANALLLVWGSAPSGGAGRQLASVLLGAAFGGAAVLWIALDRRFERMPVAWVLGLALLLRLVAVQASPLLEDDHFRYLWDGLRTATTFDPYRLPPAAFFGNANLPARWQDILGGINNPDTPTIYGPLLQCLFALAYWIAPGRLEALQALLLVLDMGVLLVLARQCIGVRWLLVYAVHPLVLKEAMASAHPDGLVALLLLVALLAWQRRRAAWTGAMLGLAVAAKAAALVVVPLLLLAPSLAPSTWHSSTASAANGIRWAGLVGVGFAATLALLYVPFILAGGSDAAALGTFGSHWRFNPLLYRVIEAVLPAGAARPAAALLIVAGIGAMAWRWRRNLRRAAAPALPPLDVALVLLLLLSPVVNPWYWLWALALSVRLGRASVAAVGLAAALSYLNSTVLMETALAHSANTPYTVPWPLALVQLLALGIAWSMDRARAAAPGAAHR